MLIQKISAGNKPELMESAVEENKVLKRAGFKSIS